MPGRGGATVLDDLPDWIVVEEILIRLLPRDILRCRAVRKWWQSATSTDKFMLDHQRRQPLLPILSHVTEPPNARLLFSFDANAGQQQLCPVVRTVDFGKLEAALDGLLIVSHGFEFSICNPVTRKCAPLGKPPSQSGFYHRIVGFYRHQPSGEYRVLWVSCPAYCDTYDTNSRIFYHAVAVGSNNTRCIIQQPTSQSPSLELALRDRLPALFDYAPVHHRGSLHWELGSWDANYIMVFNKAAETFRLMCRPARLCDCLQESLLQMDDTLALCSIRSEKYTIDVWMVQDYDAETWSFKHQINFSEVDLSALVDPKVAMFPTMVVLNDGELLIQFTCKLVLHCGIDGKFLGYVKSEDYQEIKLWITRHFLQESIIPLPLFHEMREEDGASQEHPFFIGL